MHKPVAIRPSFEREICNGKWPSDREAVRFRHLRHGRCLLAAFALPRFEIPLCLLIVRRLARLARGGAKPDSAGD